MGSEGKRTWSEEIEAVTYDKAKTSEILWILSEG